MAQLRSGARAVGAFALTLPRYAKSATAAPPFAKAQYLIASIEMATMDLYVSV